MIPVRQPRLIPSPTRSALREGIVQGPQSPLVHSVSVRVPEYNHVQDPYVPIPNFRYNTRVSMVDVPPYTIQNWEWERGELLGKPNERERLAHVSTAREQNWNQAPWRNIRQPQLAPPDEGI